MYDFYTQTEVHDDELQIQTNIYQQQQQPQVPQVVFTKPPFNVHKMPTIMVSKSRPRLTEGKGLNVGQELQMWDRVYVSLGNGFKEETPQNLTPKFVEDMVANVLESNKM